VLIDEVLLDIDVLPPCLVSYAHGQKGVSLLLLLLLLLFFSETFKALYEMAVKAEKPVHLLLVGPPASAKIVVYELTY
jgi:hypothetical protein